MRVCVVGSGGREPKDARHAMRILSSYQSGEKLKLGIMRDKRKKTLEIEVPADTHGALFGDPGFDGPGFDGPGHKPRPASAPLPPKPALRPELTTNT